MGWWGKAACRWPGGPWEEGGLPSPGSPHAQSSGTASSWGDDTCHPHQGGGKVCALTSPGQERNLRWPVSPPQVRGGLTPAAARFLGFMTRQLQPRPPASWCDADMLTAPPSPRPPSSHPSQGPAWGPDLCQISHSTSAPASPGCGWTPLGPQGKASCPLSGGQSKARAAGVAGSPSQAGSRPRTPTASYLAAQLAESSGEEAAGAPTAAWGAGAAPRFRRGRAATLTCWSGTWSSPGQDSDLSRSLDRKQHRWIPNPLCQAGD